MTFLAATLIFTTGLSVGFGVAWALASDRVAQSRWDGVADGYELGRELAFMEIATGTDARSPVERAAGLVP